MKQKLRGCVAVALVLCATADRLPAQTPPANDAFANASELSTNNGVVYGTFVGATSEPGEPNHAGTVGGRSIWWRWTAPEGTAVQLSAGSSSAQDTLLAVYTGSSVSALTPVTSNDNLDGATLHAGVSFTAVAGTTYFLAVDLKAGDLEPVGLAIRTGLHSSNDAFASRIHILDFSSPQTGNLANSTTEPGEPPHAQNGAGTIWWTWTATEDATVLLRSSSLSRITFAVYVGEAVNALTRVPTLRTFSGEVGEVMIFGARAGISYHIVAAGNTGYEDEISFSLLRRDAPSNDHFDRSITIVGSPASGQGNATWATRDIGEDAAVPAELAQSLWWNWTAATCGTVTFSPVGSSGRIAVFTGSELAHLAPIPGSPGGFSLWTAAGSTYHIAAAPDSSNKSVGLAVLFSASPGNDRFADRALLSGTSTSATALFSGATAEAGEPTHHAAALGKTVWWEWTAPSSGTAMVSSTETTACLAVYTGTDLTGLQAVANSISGAGAKNSIVFRAVQGARYLIASDTSASWITSALINLTLQNPPANDLFADRATLPGESFTFTVSNADATREPGEPQIGTIAPARTVWWRWTAPRSGSCLFTFAPPTSDVAVAIFTGSALNSLVEVSSGFTSTYGRGGFRVQGGTEYQIMVGGRDAATVWGSVSGAIVDAPVNDLFANALTMVGSTILVSGNNRGALIEPGEPAQAGGATASVWWNWTAPDSGTVTVSASMAGGGARLGIYTGSALTSLSAVLDILGGASSTRLFHAEAGTLYRIALDSPLGQYGGDFQLSLELSPAPANDMFANRTVLPAASNTVTGDTRQATREAAEVTHHYMPASRSIWWTWTAPSTGLAVISTAGSSFDTTLGVCTGQSLDALAWVATNDDENAGTHTSRLTFSAVAGTTYHIVVDGKNGSCGSVSLSAGLAPAPSNDSFSGAHHLTGSEASATGSTFGATREPGEPSQAGGLATIWWTWTAPFSGTAEMVVSPGGSHTLSVFTGESLTELSPVFDSDYSRSDYATFNALAGTTYRISVACGTAVGSSTVTLSLSLQPPPPNDMFADRILIGGNSETLTVDTRYATVEPLERNLGSRSRSCSVWWTWIAPADGRVVLSYPASDREWMPYVAAYTGDALASLSRVMEMDARATGSFTVVGGRAYHIEVNYTIGGKRSGPLSLVFGTPPTNDLFANAAALSGSSFVAEGNNLAGTIEPGEPSIRHSQLYASAWYTWTAPSSGTATVRLLSGLLGVFTGDSLASLVHVPDSAPGLGESNLVIFHAEAGTTYRVAVASFYSWGADYLLSLDLQGTPANDLFVDRQALSGAACHSAVLISGATREAIEGQHAARDIAESLWWKWTAPSDGVVELTTSGSDFDTVLAVYTGSALGALTPVAGNDNTEPGTTSRVQFQATAGTEYQFVVASKTPNAGTAVLELALIDPPANDLFANRAVLSGSDIRVTGTNWGAWTEPGEGVWAASTVWWTWTAPASGRAIIDVGGSSFAASLQVYLGSTLSSLSLVPGHRLPWGVSGLCIFDALAGTSYSICVSGSMAAGNGVELTLELVDAPANDMFAERAVLTGSAVHVSTSNHGAAAQTNEPYHTYPGSPVLWEPGASLWWSWMAPASGRVGITAIGSGFEARIAVYTGLALSGLTQVASNQPHPSSPDLSWVEFDAVAGTNYLLSVASKPRETGGLSLHILQGTPPGVPAAQSSESVVAVGGSVELTVSPSGVGPFAYQWLRNGVAVPGASSAKLTLPSAQRFQAGSYTVRVFNGAGSTVSAPISLAVQAGTVSPAARLLNLSTRALCLEGDDVLIPGFVISGSGTKRLLLRAVGPELVPFGVPVPLPDPKVVLKRWVGDNWVDHSSNDDWGTNPNVAEIIAAAESVYAFGLAEGSKSAALLLELPAGQYSAIAADAGTGTGIGMVELYDLDPSSSDTRLINIANRGYVGTGNDLMIPGFVVSPEGPKTFLIRAVGPTLANYGVTGVLADPQLVIFRREVGSDTDVRILGNDNWGENGDRSEVSVTGSRVYAFPLVAESKDAAFVVTLTPAIYMVQASGVNGATGVALVEVYVVE